MKLIEPDVGVYHFFSETNPGEFEHYSRMTGPGLAPVGRTLTIEIPGLRGWGHSKEQLRKALLNAMLGRESLFVTLLMTQKPPLGFYEAVDDEFAAGEHDSRLKELGLLFRSFETVPVMLRIGGPINSPISGLHINEMTFTNAYRHVVDVLRADGVTNVSYCLGFSEDGLSPGRVSAMDLYPGQDYVDWFGLDLRDPQSFPALVYGRAGSQVSAQNAENALLSAKALGKPLMLTSTYPLGYRSSHEGELSLDNRGMFAEWFEPMFELVKQNPSVKAWVIEADLNGVKWTENAFLWGRWMAALMSDEGFVSAGQFRPMHGL